jgi:hypothetical protein
MFILMAKGLGDRFNPLHKKNFFFEFYFHKYTHRFQHYNIQTINDNTRTNNKITFLYYLLKIMEYSCLPK